MANFSGLFDLTRKLAQSGFEQKTQAHHACPQTRSASELSPNQLAGCASSNGRFCRGKFCYPVNYKTVTVIGVGTKLFFKALLESCFLWC